MKIKKVLIVFFLIAVSIGGYYLYKYIQNLNYEKIDEEIEYLENGEEELLGDTKEEKVVDEDKILGNTEETEVVEQKKVVIHIAGEVVNSGVFELNEGSRIVDQTTTNMILIIKSLFVGKPLISIEI